MSGRARGAVLVVTLLMATTMPTHVATLDARPGDVAATTGPRLPAADAEVSDSPQAAGVVAPERPDFKTFLEQVRADALARGISEKTLDAALTGLEPQPTVIERDRSQAEIVLSVDEYVARLLTKKFVRTARERHAHHRALLKSIAAQYGVQPRYLVAIWGIESNYGRFSGVRPTVQALATLAWEGRRGPFFRGELLDALEIVDRGYIGLDQLKGSWAGAMGQTQFMPSSYLKHAQDFDKDGDRDIWKSEHDVFASIANYLKAYGWSDDETWGREVRMPKGGALPVVSAVGLRQQGCRAEREMTNRAPLSRWHELGVRALDGKPLPSLERNASLVHTGKRSFLVYGNYEALLGYNCAHTYALSVALLAERIGS